MDTPWQRRGWIVAIAMNDERCHRGSVNTLINWRVRLQSELVVHDHMLRKERVRGDRHTVEQRQDGLTKVRLWLRDTGLTRIFDLD
jgi:hypothetical protein